MSPTLLSLLDSGSWNLEKFEMCGYAQKADQKKVKVRTIMYTLLAEIQKEISSIILRGSKPGS